MAILFDMSSPILSFMSFNCREFNSTKHYIPAVLDKCNFLLLQELEIWLSGGQLVSLGNLRPNILYEGTSGYANSEVLAGRPYGGCAIMWHSNIPLRPLKRIALVMKGPSLSKFLDPPLVKCVS